MAIGTTAAILGAAALGAAGSVASGVIGASGARRAADAQVQAAHVSADVQREGIAEQRRQYDQSRTDNLPWLEAGRKALGQYQIELGLEPGESQFQKTPGYDFAVEEGERGVINNLAALGMKNSGAALKALTRFRTGLANQTYDNYLNRLASSSGSGQTAGANLASIGQNAANAVQAGLQGIGRTHQEAGQARASGFMGAANSWQNALSSGVGNVSNALGMLAFRGGGNALGGFPPAPVLGGGMY